MFLLLLVDSYTCTRVVMKCNSLVMRMRMYSRPGMTVHAITSHAHAQSVSAAESSNTT